MYPGSWERVVYTDEDGSTRVGRRPLWLGPDAQVERLVPMSQCPYGELCGGPVACPTKHPEELALLAARTKARTNSREPMRWTPRRTGGYRGPRGSGQNGETS
jgi:hypothetical protein